MVGVKRPYPFPPEYPPVPAFQKFPPCYIAHVSGSHESASFSNECTVHSESGTVHKRFDISPEDGILLVFEYLLTSLFGQFFREVPLRSGTLSETTPRNVIRGNRALDGDILTLAPPTAVGKGNQQDFSKFETTPFQVSNKRTSISTLFYDSCILYAYLFTSFNSTGSC